MSCMPISFKALAGVRETLLSSFYWTAQTDENPLSLCHAFAGGSSRSIGEKRMNDLALEFVEQAFVFNSVEYFRGEYARENAEPIEWGGYFAALKKSNSKRLPIIQMFKTLQMIDYNTEPKGWMTESEYANWARREEFERFKKTMNRIISCIACFIVSRTEAYKNADWCL